MANRKLYLVVGRQRGGKSYWTNELLKRYTAAGGCGLVYNLGRQSDFSAAQVANFRSFKEEGRAIKVKGGKEALKEYKEDRRILNYIRKGKVYSFKNFIVDNAGKALKFTRKSQQETHSVLEEFFLYAPYTLFVFDDCKYYFRGGPPSESMELLTRINHVGGAAPVKSWQDGGADVVLIFHAIDHVNPQLWDLATHLVYFSENRKPDVSKIRNPELESIILKAWDILDKAPLYSYSVTDLKDLETEIFIKQ